VVAAVVAGTVTAAQVQEKGQVEKQLQKQTVVDLGAGAIVYQRLLDLDVFQSHNEGAARGVGSSPTLAGGHIYVSGNNGATLVFEPGRAWRPVSKNKIEGIVLGGHWSERQERFIANPVFEGKRLYLRGEANLYAIEAR